MSRSIRVAGLLALAASAVLAIGCGETVVDDVKTEGALQKNLESTLTEKVNEVECPSGVEVEAGTVFECEVTVSGGEVRTAKMRITNEDADIEVIRLVGSAENEPSDAGK